MSRIGRVEMSPLVQRGIDHQLEALLRGRKLGDVVAGVSSSNMLLHGAIAFLLQMTTFPVRCLPFFFLVLRLCTFSLTVLCALEELTSFRDLEGREAVRFGACRTVRTGEGDRHSPPSIVCGNWSHHCWSTGRRPRCWRQRQKRSWSGKLVVAWSACIDLFCSEVGEEEGDELGGKLSTPAALVGSDSRSHDETR